MLLIKTRIGPSKIHGIGLFAAQFIPEGTAIWRFAPGFDLEISKNDFFKLSQPAQEQVLHYSYFDSDSEKYILAGDDARFLNHSKTPNIIDVDSEYSPTKKGCGLGIFSASLLAFAERFLSRTFLLWGCTEDEYGITIASKDIDEGEEITCDYETFDDEYAGYERLLKHSQSTDHQTGHSDIDQSFARLGKHLVVETEPSALSDPGKSPFHYPAPRQEDKAFLTLRT